MKTVAVVTEYNDAFGDIRVVAVFEKYADAEAFVLVNDPAGKHSWWMDIDEYELQ